MMHSENNIEPLQVYPALLNELLLHHRQAIVLLSANAVITFSTKSIRPFTGYENEELLGRAAFVFFDSADVSSARQQHEYVTRAGGNSFTSIVRVCNKSGDMIWIDVVVRNLLYVPGINAIFVLLKTACHAGAEERKIVQAMTAAREEERAFIACELHDNVNQIITATNFWWMEH